MQPKDNDIIIVPQPETFPLNVDMYKNLGSAAVADKMNNGEKEMKTVVTNHGAVRNVIETNSPSDIPNIWTGKISLQNRIEGNTDLGIVAEIGLVERVAKAISLENIDKYYVPASLQARTRCIDGRLLEGWNDSEELQKRELGAQVPGGTPLAALTTRLVDVHDMNASTDFESDIVSVVNRLKEVNLGFGGHIDDHQHAGNTGCGAIDQIPTQLEKLKDPITQLQLRGLTRAMLGERYSESVVDAIIGRAVSLASYGNTYFKKDANGSYQYKNKVVNLLRENSTQSDPVAKLIGDHKEVGLVVNFVKGTTFDRDKFNADNGGDIQLFGFDFWRVEQVAQILYPENVDKQVDYVTTRALLAVAVTMTLTDGTLNLLTRTDS